MKKLLDMFRLESPLGLVGFSDILPAPHHRTGNPKSKPLTAELVHDALPKLKIYSLCDGKRLYLEVHPSGGKYWRFRYRRDGKDCKISLGIYPKVRLANARIARNNCLDMLADGFDPGGKAGTPVIKCSMS